MCEHLKPLDDFLTASGTEVVYRDAQPWSENCRNWTRYKCVLDLIALRQQFQLDSCVEDWEIEDHWQGYERGFVCNIHHDAVIGDTETSAHLDARQIDQSAKVKPLVAISLLVGAVILALLMTVVGIMR